MRGRRGVMLEVCPECGEDLKQYTKNNVPVWDCVTEECSVIEIRYDYFRGNVVRKRIKYDSSRVSIVKL